MKGLLLNYQYGMWDAVLNRTKTNTRRCPAGLDEINKNPSDYSFVGEYRNKETVYAEFKNVWTQKITRVIIRNKPRSYAFLQEPVLKHQENTFYKYRDHNGHDESIAFGPLIEKAISEGANWENKYFMKEEHARYYVKFIRWTAERLNDISIEDCYAEGVSRENYSFFYTKDEKKVLFSNIKNAYFGLYKAVNNIKEHNNPWVISYHFELCQKPEK